MAREVVTFENIVYAAKEADKLGFLCEKSVTIHEKLEGGSFYLIAGKLSLQFEFIRRRGKWEFYPCNSTWCVIKGIDVGEYSTFLEHIAIILRAVEEALAS